MSGFRMVGTTDLQNVRFLNDSGFRMVGFRIPTVLGKGEIELRKDYNLTFIPSKVIQYSVIA